jgi:type II secretion system protein H
MVQAKNQATRYMATGISSKLFLPVMPVKTGIQVTKGFTLIELLIVLVIIGIVVGTVSLSLIHRNHSGFSTKASVNLLRTKILFAEQQATILNKTIGLSFSKKGYQFSNYTGTGTKAYWKEITTSSLKKKNWPLDVSITIKTQGANLPEDLPADFQASPQVIIGAAGDISLFTLYVNNQYTLESTTGNDIVLTIAK